MNTPKNNQYNLFIVVPCYNEEAVLVETTRQLTKVLDTIIQKRLINIDSCILYINDGSTDKTWELIEYLHQTNKYVAGVNLAGNVGHQNALMAGLTIAVDKSDIVITIDADLQDDPNAIQEMIIKYTEGNDIVYGVRKNRTTDTWFKRTTALGFYSMMKWLGVKSVYNHADYRLMSKRALQYLLQFRERNLFLRGIIPLIGYQTTNVYYNRAKRFAGESKYPISKMLSFALDGVTSFSTKPIHLLLYLGGGAILVAFCILAWILFVLIMGKTVVGWTSIIASIWLIGGFILIGIGIVGEYIGKIYIEVKNRPRFNVKDILIHNNTKKNEE
ncbi:glycosyltransferase family 2 protein [Bacteroides eggerthii]|uniref:glycosyltransferase family 2 protein n=1 Tax=Bacteroides eggerthii TaxID=28111 RepID=UPI003561E241